MAFERPFPAYQGPNRHVFVCYAHGDAATVYPQITKLHENGIDVWYDEGIEVGQEWRAEIAEALNKAKTVLFYQSEASSRSRHCVREISYALNRDIPVLRINLDGSELPSGLSLGLEMEQAINPRDYSLSEYTAKLLRTLRATSPEATATPPLRQRALRWPLVATLALALALAIVLGWIWRDSPVPTPAQDGLIHVAVLPFQNTSGDAAQNYIGDAMSEEIWNRLRNETALQLIAMTSARAAIGQGLDARQIAETLNVEYLVEGSVARAGNQARINVRLIDARNGSDVWSNRFDRDMDSMSGIFGLYDEISAGVASAFNLALGAGASSAPSPTENVLAYNLIEQAWYNYRNGLIDQVEPLVDRALDVDPNYARAHTMKGWWVRNKTDNREILPAAAGYREARRHIERALELDPGYGPALVQLGSLHMRMELDFRLAMQTFRQAEAAGVRLEFLASDKSYLLQLVGRLEEALSLIESVAAQDPLFVPLRIQTVPILDELGRSDEARALVEELMALTPHDERWVQYAVQQATFNDDFARARALLETVNDTDAGWVSVSGAFLEMREGNPARLRELAERIALDPSAHPFWLAEWFWFLQDYEAHLQWFNRAMDEAALLQQLPLVLRSKPGYWQILNGWALSEPATRETRLADVAKHRARIEKLTVNMVL